MGLGGVGVGRALGLRPPGLQALRPQPSALGPQASRPPGLQASRPPGFQASGSPGLQVSSFPRPFTFRFPDLHAP